ncbi:MAG TPA: chemotaxis protein CheB [Terriglobia bacterium]|nr:chemotaxis protein CheB [Terriglobia bacterium]
MTIARSSRKISKARAGKKRKHEKQIKKAFHSFTVVGIGASAGGLDAFERLLKHLPSNLGMAYVLVQHLDPTHRSHLTEILSRATRMAVAEVEDGMRVLPNRVYIIPPNTTMTLRHGVLELVPRQDSFGAHLPIDFFLRSLANAQKHKAVGIILSGTASDGAAGMKAIKVAGGVTFAQDLDSARYGGMPQSSISAGVVDFVLPPEGIADELKKMGSHPYFRPKPGKKTGMVPLELEEDGNYRAILNNLRRLFGVDFIHYKQSTIQRRIRRRMALNSVATLREYASYLEADHREAESLYKDMFVNVSGFFREPEAFKRLQRLVFPKLFKKKPGDLPIRVWVPGCSTGEEAYSLGISLLEFMRERAGSVQIQVFATDISDDAIEKARRGRYLNDVSTEIEPRRLQRWFTKTEDGYQINKAVRDLVIFAKHDATKDPPFSRLDLVSCRNLLIYLGPELQQKLIPLFHYALKPDGYLFLGVAESVGSFQNLFNSIDKKYKIFVKKPFSVRPRIEFGGEHLTLQAAVQRESKLPERLPASAEALKEAADLMVLNEYAPPSVLVNEEADILQFRGRTGAYLEPATGNATLNLLKMAREGLLPDLHVALDEARRKNSFVRREGVEFDQNGESKTLNLFVTPVNTPLTQQRCFLVMFQEHAERAASRARKGEMRKKKAPHGVVSSDKFLKLKQEQLATKAYLESVIARQDASNEELRSLNEEIMSSNEELQSTSEELETANEELQSANEELTTLNEELHNRNLELGRANNDILNILTSMNLSLVIVDPELRIRRFTPTAQTLFNLLPTDIGRLITDFSFKMLPLPHLTEYIRDAIAGNTPKPEDVRDETGHWFTLQVRPYTTSDKEIDGAVVALIDIHARVTREAQMKQTSAELQHQTEERQEAQDQLRGVHQRLQDSAVSKERDAMAREMHDGLGQVLAGVAVQLEAADGLLSPQQDALRKHLASARGLAREGLEDVRRTAWAWHTPGPLEEGQLSDAIERIGHRLFDSTPIKFHFHAQGDPHNFSLPIANNLLKLAQEAMVNVLRHSKSTEVRVRLMIKNGEARLEVSDQGQGFDLKASRTGYGFGLISMQERAESIGARFEVTSMPGQGTRVEVVVPFEKKK